MKAAVLYSGGKDSSLVAVMLERLGYEVELLTANFGVFPSWEPAAESASCLGFKHRILKMDTGVLEEAVETILNDGFPTMELTTCTGKSCIRLLKTIPGSRWYQKG